MSTSLTCFRGACLADAGAEPAEAGGAPESGDGVPCTRQGALTGCRSTLNTKLELCRQRGTSLVRYAYVYVYLAGGLPSQVPSSDSPFSYHIWTHHEACS